VFETVDGISPGIATNPDRGLGPELVFAIPAIATIGI
jgi:hypothetical protein